MKIDDANDTSFGRRLRQGLAIERRIADLLLDEGHWVRTPCPKPESPPEPSGFPSDIVVRVGGREVSVEVKGRSCTFSGPADYPFEKVIVEDERRWVTRPDRPFAIVLVSGVTSGLAVLPSYTEDRWRTEEWDRYGTLIVAPRSCLKPWWWLTSRLEEMSITRLVG